MAIKYIHTERATLAEAKKLLASALPGVPIWVRWYRIYDNPHGGGAFGKSREYCTCELIGVTAKRLTVRVGGGEICHPRPERCFFAERRQV